MISDAASSDLIEINKPGRVVEVVHKNVLGTALNAEMTEHLWHENKLHRDWSRVDKRAERVHGRRDIGCVGEVKSQ